jgi:hypothetical protein
MFPRELNISVKPKERQGSMQLQFLFERAIVLILLSFALCVVISVMGGFFATLINLIQGHELAETSGIIGVPEMNFKFALVRKGFPALLVEIGSRIPINILDRLLSSFVAFALALLMARMRRKS